MTTTDNAHSGKVSPFKFQFHSIRRISSPEDIEADRQIHIGQAPISSILDLPVDENVRTYLLEDKKRKVYTQVHRAIRYTLENSPEEFSVLNSGVTIVARNCEIDEKNRTLFLENPSIINGSQTQGVVKDYMESDGGGWLSDKQPHIKFEIIVTNDDDLIANVSIARNFQNEVASISIVGRRGQLKELDERFRRTHPHLQLRTKETDPVYEDTHFVDTERILQVIAALVPQKLWLRGEFNKVYTYSQKNKCLREFEEIYNITENAGHKDHAKYAKLYEFYLDVVGQAYDLHDKWKKNQAFKGTGLHSIRRGKRGVVLEVPDGIVFPILASLSVFAVETPEGWRINAPEKIDRHLIEAAKTSYIEIADSNPNVMGKSKACYSYLAKVNMLYQEFSQPEKQLSISL